ncbi:hypothetical protein [Flavobacterium sp. PL02]|uniref:hypothetical protein n=1 Tax=Flavobacterium sp. PL02 TaxID=3088354 RepID=UPI002B22D1D9|nr:hypothetical protein [Flavobacterium sp. PL02]MEA9412972.1 hypothetical protein [Flavobacterium sp. PL02]
MKYNRLILIFFLVFNWLANAQIDNIDTKAKYIFDSDKLITEEDGRIYMTFYNFKYDPETGKAKMVIKNADTPFNTIEDLLTYYKKSKEDLIALSDLKEEKSSTIIDDLRKKQFSFPEGNKKMNVIDRENVVIRSYIKSELGDIVLGDATFFSLHPITINKKYTAFIIENNKLRYSYGYILPIKNKYIFKFESQYFLPEIISKTDISDTYNAIGLNYKKGNLYKKNDKYGLKSESGNQILMQPIYDTIYYYENFILSKKEKLFKAHYKNGELLNIPKIRGIIHTNNGYGALVNNQTYWLESSGKLLDSLPKERPMYVCGTVPQIVVSIVKEKDNFKFYYFSGGSGYTPYGYENILCSSNSLKDIAFLDQQTKIETDSNHDFLVKTLLAANSYIVETLDHNKSIAKFNNGKIEYLLNPDKYSFEYIYNDILKFELRGLFGLYPFHKKPKYTKLLNFEKGFARFEFPNGKKGWLDLEGKEYLDI